MSRERDQVLALAGVFQAAALAQQLARRGYEEEEPFEASVRSLFIKDAINTASVFGGESGLALERIKPYIEGKTVRKVIYIENKLLNIVVS